VKHLKELAQCVAEAYDAYVVFIIQMQGVSHFTPNYKMHPEFGAALAEAIGSGVKATAFDCLINADTITINDHIPIKM